MKNNKSFQNRKTFKTKKHKVGTFTTVPYSVLNNPKIKPTPKLLLIQILSDNDTFTLSPSLYAKRLGVTLKTIYNALDELVELGYVRRKEIDADTYIAGIKKKNSKKKLYHYTVSEFGKLNNKSADETENNIPIENEQPVAETPTECTADEHNKNVRKLTDYISSWGNFKDDNIIMKEVNQIIETYLVDGRLLSYNEPKEAIDKFITSMKKVIYKNCLDVNLKQYPKASDKSIKWLKNLLRQDIFDNSNIPNDAVVENKWRHHRLKPKPLRTDYETEMADRREQAYENRY